MYLGLHLDKVESILKDKKYTIKTIKGKKDSDKLTVPRVIKSTQKGDSIELIVTYFSDSK